MPISPSKSRDLADENNKILTEWKWFKTTELDFFSASSLKQQSTDRLVPSLGHMSLIPSQPVFTLFP
jgi:hypothetical protein